MSKTGGSGPTFTLPVVLSFAAQAGFCVLLFLVSLRNIRNRWIH